MIDLPPLFRVALTLTGAALFVVAMCRLRYISRATTLGRVRAAAVALAAAGALLVLTGTARPDWLLWSSVVTPAAAVAWAMATSHAWRGALPASMALPKRPPEVVWRPAPPRWEDTVTLSDRRRQG